MLTVSVLNSNPTIILYIPDITIASFGPHVWKGILSDQDYALHEIISVISLILFTEKNSTGDPPLPVSARLTTMN